MIDARTNKEINEISELQKSQLYIYIMLNNVGKIKIGKTRNISKRYRTLCGSNGQGNIITNVYVSEATYLYVIERILHDKFAKYRIPKTEWFIDKEDPSGIGLFNAAIKELELLFSSDNYKQSNLIRKKIHDKKCGVKYDN